MKRVPFLAAVLLALAVVRTVPFAAAESETASTKIEGFAAQHHNAVKTFGRSVAIQGRDDCRLNLQEAVFSATGSANTKKASTERAYGIRVESLSLKRDGEVKETYLDYDEAKEMSDSLNFMLEQAAIDKGSPGDVTIEFEVSNESHVAYGYLEKNRKMIAFVDVNRHRVLLDMTTVAHLKSSLDLIVKQLEDDGAAEKTSAPSSVTATKSSAAQQGTERSSAQ